MQPAFSTFGGVLSATCQNQILVSKEEALTYEVRASNKVAAGSCQGVELTRPPVRYGCSKAA